MNTYRTTQNVTGRTLSLTVWVCGRAAGTTPATDLDRPDWHMLQVAAAQIADKIKTDGWQS